MTSVASVPTWFATVFNPVSKTRFVFAFFALVLLANPTLAAFNELSVNAGNVYHVDLFVRSATDYWTVFFGSATSAGNSSYTSVIDEPYNRSDPNSVAPRVHRVVVQYAPNCMVSSDWLIASPNESINWAGWTSATLDDLNRFAGIPNGSVEDAGRFFLSNGSFSWAGVEYVNATWTQLNPVDRVVFKEYVFKDPEGRFIFAVPLFFPYAVGFDDSQVNYEILLPRGPKYYFMADSRFCIYLRGSGSSAVDETPVVDSKTNAVEPPKDDNKPVSETKEAASESSQSETATVVKSENSFVQVERSPGQTVISAVYTFPKAGTQTLIVDFGIPSSFLVKGEAEIHLDKLEPGSHTVKAISDQLSKLTFASSFDARFQALGNMTRAVWVLDVQAGDVYSARAVVRKELPLEVAKLTQVQSVVGNIIEKLFPPQKSPRRFDVEVQQWASGGLYVVLATLGLGFVFLVFVLWRRPWIVHYLSASRFAYLYHFFLVSRKRHHYR